jgi:hypothetical protein
MNIRYCFVCSKIIVYKPYVYFCDECTIKVDMWFDWFSKSRTTKIKEVQHG